MFMLKKLLVEKMYVELLCMSNWSMLKYMHDEIMYVEKCVCWFLCISKYLQVEKFVGRTTTFHKFTQDFCMIVVDSKNSYLELYNCKISHWIKGSSSLQSG